MKTVQQQIVDDVIRLVASIPELESRVFGRGLVGWNKRSFPLAAVTAAKTSVETQRTGTGRRSGRVQDRTTEVVVEIHSLEEDGVDYVASLVALAGAVEVVVAPSQMAVAIDDCLLTSDTGVTRLQSDENGLRSAIALRFAVTYLTVEGRPGEFVEPNY